MIVLDVNLLLYAYDGNSLVHEKARLWWQSTVSGPELIGLPWQTIHAFVRISTDARISGNQVSMKKVLALVEQWMNLPNARVLTPGERHWSLLNRMLLEGQARGPTVTDAQLAALTMEYGGVLYTTDRDFARFPGLRWVNPLLESAKQR
jgi:toxin-antitoxin system PIN domain toxin